MCLHQADYPDTSHLSPEVGSFEGGGTDRPRGGKTKHILEHVQRTKGLYGTPRLHAFVKEAAFITLSPCDPNSTWCRRQRTALQGHPSMYRPVSLCRPSRLGRAFLSAVVLNPPLVAIEWPYNPQTGKGKNAQAFAQKKRTEKPYIRCQNQHFGSETLLSSFLLLGGVLTVFFINPDAGCAVMQRTTGVTFTEVAQRWRRHVVRNRWEIVTSFQGTSNKAQRFNQGICDVQSSLHKAAYVARRDSGHGRYECCECKVTSTVRLPLPIASRVSICLYFTTTASPSRLPVSRCFANSQKQARWQNLFSEFPFLPPIRWLFLRPEGRHSFSQKLSRQTQGKAISVSPKPYSTV